MVSPPSAIIPAVLLLLRLSARHLQGNRTEPQPCAGAPNSSCHDNGIQKRGIETPINRAAGQPLAGEGSHPSVENASSNTEIAPTADFTDERLTAPSLAWESTAMDARPLETAPESDFWKSWDSHGMVLFSLGNLTTNAAEVSYRHKHDSVCEGSVLAEPRAPVFSLAQCEQRCSGNTECAVFVYQVVERRCVLKRGCYRTWYSPQHVSGVKRSRSPPLYARLPNTTCTYFTHDNFDADSEAECRQGCNEDFRCRAYSYKERKGRCYLKEHCFEGNVERDEDYVTGVDVKYVKEVMRETAPRHHAETAHSHSFEYLDEVMCGGVNIRTEIRVDSIYACELLCAKMGTDRCAAFSFSSAKQRCVLMADCNSSTYNPVYTSGVFRTKSANMYNNYPGMGCDTHSIKSYRAVNWTECQAQCDAVRECNAYTFKKKTGDRTGRCYTKTVCDEVVVDDTLYSGVDKYHDVMYAEEPTCPAPAYSCQATGGQVCPTWTDELGESSDPEPRTIKVSPYQDILDGRTNFTTTYPDVRDYPTCRFQPPNDPLPSQWADACIDNLQRVGMLFDRYARPNEECPAGWFLCKGMCYTLVQRFSRGPEEGPSYYDGDYMSVEARCGSCGGARVAFVGEDKEMLRVVAEAARQTINEDKATWVRRYRFLREPNPVSESGKTPYQPWHRYVTMFREAPERMTYQRYYTGLKDDLDVPQYDRRFRNQEASILCVNTLPRIQAAVKTINSGLTMEGGCEGEDRHNMWDNDKHRWWPEHNWPFPGL